MPMLAKRVGGRPEGDGWIYEPKWCGFRVLVFRDGDEIFLQVAMPSRSAGTFPSSCRRCSPRYPSGASSTARS